MHSFIITRKQCNGSAFVSDMSPPHLINGRNFFIVELVTAKVKFLPRKNIEIYIYIKGNIHPEWYLKAEQVFGKCQP